MLAASAGLSSMASQTLANIWPGMTSTARSRQISRNAPAWSRIRSSRTPDLMRGISRPTSVRPGPMSKSFLVLFFKKELLSSFAGALGCAGAALTRPCGDARR
jgi:hypothetical protein